MAQEHRLSARPDELPYPFLQIGVRVCRTGGSRATAADLSSAGIRNRSPSSGGHFVPAAPDTTVPVDRRSAMRSKDLMCPDLLSEIVLLGVGVLILVALLLLTVTALTRA